MTVVTTPGTLSLADAALWAGGRVWLREGADPGATRLSGASIDTRTIEPGALFVPLAGEHADGHEFITRAFERGAGAALCLESRAQSWGQAPPGPLLLVADVTAALQAIAMKITGHKTDSIFRRYLIVDEELLAQATGAVAQYLEDARRDSRRTT